MHHALAVQPALNEGNIAKGEIEREWGMKREGRVAWA
jgi:hypothetical protein